METYDQLNSFFIDAHLDATKQRIYKISEQSKELRNILK